MKKECEWCRRKFKPQNKQRFCSIECMKAVFDYRDDLMRTSNDISIDDAVSKHKEITIGRTEKKECVFVHYSSSGGRWEYK